MKNVKVIVERGSDNRYSAYMDCYDLEFGLAGFGNSAKEAIEDFYEAWDEEKAMYAKEGKVAPALEFDIQYDIASFLNFFAGVLSKSGFEKITGINQKQLMLYSSGMQTPEPDTVRKIQNRLYHFADELKQVRFINNE